MHNIWSKRECLHECQQTSVNIIINTTNNNNEKKKKLTFYYNGSSMFRRV